MNDFVPPSLLILGTLLCTARKLQKCLFFIHSWIIYKTFGNIMLVFYDFWKNYPRCVVNNLKHTHTHTPANGGINPRLRNFHCSLGDDPRFRDPWIWPLSICSSGFRFLVELFVTQNKTQKSSVQDEYKSRTLFSSYQVRRRKSTVHTVPFRLFVSHKRQSSHYKSTRASRILCLLLL